MVPEILSGKSTIAIRGAVRSQCMYMFSFTTGCHIVSTMALTIYNPTSNV